MTKLVCKDCGYVFEGKKDDRAHCPYCGKKNIEDEQNAEELIEDVKKILG